MKTKLYTLIAIILSASGFLFFKQINIAFGLMYGATFASLLLAGWYYRIIAKRGTPAGLEPRIKTLPFAVTHSAKIPLNSKVGIALGNALDGDVKIALVNQMLAEKVIEYKSNRKNDMVEVTMTVEVVEK